MYAVHSQMVQRNVIHIFKGNKIINNNTNKYNLETHFGKTDRRYRKYQQSYMF